MNAPEAAGIAVAAYDLALLRLTLAEMTRTRWRGAPTQVEVATWSEDDEIALVHLWYRHMRIRVGEDLFDLQRRCGGEGHHSLRRICSHCGFSSNLYFEGLGHAFRGRDQPDRRGRRIPDTDSQGGSD